MTTKALPRDRIRRIYDRIGALQDTQAFYEDPATSLLLRRGRFSGARRVFELGCGTGRLAERMLTGRLPADATYRGVDLSPTMVRLARTRLEPFGARARVELSDGRPPADEPASAYDRFVSTYVLDLLSEDEIHAVAGEAHRMLEPGGLLCLCSLCTGAGPVSRVVARAWSAAYRLSPRLVGGCRPLELTRYLPTAAWTVLSSDRLAPFGVPSEVVVAERRS